MEGRLALDFGTSNTVLAVWDAARREGVPYHLPDLGRELQARRGERIESFSLIPSIIHYAADGRRWVGRQVHDQNLYESPGTFRWMKRYIGQRSPLKVRVAGREVSHFDAGRDFLAAVLAAIRAELDLTAEEAVAFTVPVEAFEHYEDWLTGVAEAASLGPVRLLDEPSAAALGYGIPIQPGDVYLIFDFGGGTLDVSVVTIEEASGTFRRCRVLGKAGTELGGATIDAWLFQEVLKQNDVRESDDAVRKLSRALLVECERAKERLSVHDDALLRVEQDAHVLEARLTRARFEEILDEHDAYTRIDQTIRRALNSSRERGYDDENIKAVLLVGGGSLIPGVQRTVQRVFGKERIRLERPLDAVARGAAAFVAGVDFYDHIQHDYAIRWSNYQTGDYDYRVLVERGTPYPSTKPLARLTIKATHQGQAQLGIAIFELGQRSERSRSPEALELVFDPTGAARLTQLSPDEEERRRLFWVNENNPTFLAADPPGIPGEPRFEVEFGIDANKRLLISARDLKTGRVSHRDHPVVKLT